MMAIDALTAPLLTKAFIAAAKKASGGKPFTHLIDTHRHGDHIAGNQFLLPREIVSHEYCRDEVAKPAGRPLKSRRTASSVVAPTLSPPSGCCNRELRLYPWPPW
jgi:glyoxylase-like metal-dependent hydrolase (beta-lactamase superfamily II)